MSIDKSKFPDEYGYRTILDMGLTTDYQMIAREAGVQNPSEAGATESYLDIHWPYLEQEGRYLLCFIDNGPGMTPQEMKDLLKDIGHTKNKVDIGQDDNFGHGVRAMSLARNPAGVEFFSKTKGGRLSSIKLVVQDGVIGAEKFTYVGDDGLEYEDIVRDRSTRLGFWNAWPEIVKESGTIVVLHGHGDDDTIRLNDLPLQWSQRFLQKRYWHLPIKVKSTIITTKDRAKWPKDRSQAWKTHKTGFNNRRTILSASEVVAEMMVDAGYVNVEGATVYWHILGEDEQRAMSKRHQFAPTNGFIAALHKGELFDFMDGRSSLWDDFGISVGWERVVLVVEPDEGLVKQKRERDSLRLIASGNSLPWEDWAEQFIEVMPDSLYEYVQEQRNKKFAKRRKERNNELNKVMQKFGVPTFQKDAYGESRASNEISVREGTETGGGGGGGGGGRRKKLNQEDPEGQPAIKRRALPSAAPEVSWLLPGNTENLGTAAHYVESENYIIADPDYEVYGRLKNILRDEAEKLSDKGTANEALNETVRMCAEYLLQEKVLSTRRLFVQRPGSPWNSADLKEELSDRALTGSLGHAYMVSQFGAIALKDVYKRMKDDAKKAKKDAISEAEEILA